MPNAIVDASTPLSMTKAIGKRHLERSRRVNILIRQHNHHTKQVEVIGVEEDLVIVVVTVLSRYF
ncbi:MAG: hypothetical protein HYZ34_12155 [Ignavibacteriae bacterium]|nr:hypothetical protein [Ignavibacteriota bacterium]